MRLTQQQLTNDRTSTYPFILTTRLIVLSLSRCIYAKRKADEASMKLAIMYVHCVKICFQGYHQVQIIIVNQRHSSSPLPSVIWLPAHISPSYRHNLRRSGVRFAWFPSHVSYRLHNILSPAIMGTSLKSTPNPWLNSLPFLLPPATPLTLLVPALPPNPAPRS